MVSSQTTDARDKKQAEQKRLIEEAEKEVGKKEDHPEDDLILNTRYIATIVGSLADEQSRGDCGLSKTQERGMDMSESDGDLCMFS